MILSLKNGSFSYNKKQNVFSDISFEVTDGDLLAILGPNGAGKTTLLKSIMGLLKLDSGESFLDGVSIKSMSYKKLFGIISYVPQAKNSTGAYSVEEMILLGTSAQISTFSTPKEKDLKIVDEMIKKLNLESIRYKKCSEISGGELQMVLIAKALAAKPKILVLDEPESNLDFKNQLLVLEIMSELTKSGMICIFNTHYPAHALQRANKSLILCKGGEYTFGNTAEIITESAIQNAFSVKAVIGSVETEQKQMPDIIPIKIENTNKTPTDDLSHIAIISVISADKDSSEQINSIFHQYMPYIVGRMGMPYKKKKLNIINLTLDAPKSIINELTLKLSQLNVSVKTTFAPQENIYE